jgi:hypothetical protein
VPASPISPAFTPSAGLVEVTVLEQDAKVARGIDLADRRFSPQAAGLILVDIPDDQSKVEHRSPVACLGCRPTVTVAAVALRTVWRLTRRFHLRQLTRPTAAAAARRIVLSEFSPAADQHNRATAAPNARIWTAILVIGVEWASAQITSPLCCCCQVVAWVFFGTGDPAKLA